ncbi:hypothetical protein IG631_08726 [Alternaria alternata]|nr:hypothetical protein IG631_08726 [Alternaria alternata]
MQIEQAITNNIFALNLVDLPLDLLALIRFSSLQAADPSSRAEGSGVEHAPLPPLASNISVGAVFGFYHPTAQALGGIGTLKPHSARLIALVVVDCYNDSLPGVHTTAVWMKKGKTIPARTLHSVLFVGRTWRNTGLILEIVPNNRLE